MPARRFWSSSTISTSSSRRTGSSISGPAGGAQGAVCCGHGMSLEQVARNPPFIHGKIPFARAGPSLIPTQIIIMAGSPLLLCGTNEAHGFRKSVCDAPATRRFAGRHGSPQPGIPLARANSTQDPRENAWQPLPLLKKEDRLASLLLQGDNEAILQNGICRYASRFKSYRTEAAQTEALPDFQMDTPTWD